MYKSSLRHIHDPVLSSLKMKSIRLLFSYNFCLKHISYYEDVIINVHSSSCKVPVILFLSDLNEN
jgi:hypothetical protein